MNYACHADVVCQNYAVSADYPGVACRKVEEAFGTNFVCLFVQGAGGNIELLGDRVAIKLLPPEMRSNTEWLRRFQREGQAARRFRHPNERRKSHAGAHIGTAVAMTKLAPRLSE